MGHWFEDIVRPIFDTHFKQIKTKAYSNPKPITFAEEKTDDIFEHGLHPIVQDLSEKFMFQIKKHKLNAGIFEGIRTFKRQKELYYVRKTTKAKPGFSWHNYGLACFDEETQILTDSGWKYFKDLRNELVVVFKDGNLFYQKPNSYISYFYEGDMVSIETRSVSQLITPNHKSVVKRLNDKDWFYVTADNLKTHYYIPTSGNFKYFYNDNYNPLKRLFPKDEDFYSFMGWYLSEGYSVGCSDGKQRNHGLRFKVAICQIKEKHVKSIDKLLSRTNLHYSYNGREFIIHKKELWKFLMQFGNQQQRYIPREMLFGSKKCLNNLYKSLIDGDGSRYNTYDCYFTTSQKLADDFSELCVMLGKSSSITARMRKENHSKSLGYTIKPNHLCYEIKTRLKNTHMLKRGDSTKVFKNKKYSGMVYCVETNAGSVVIRRNGKVSISGNCDVVFKTKSGKWSWSDAYNWKLLGKIGKDLGFKWGGDWGWDFAHFEWHPMFKKCSEAYDIYKVGGQDAVWKHVDDWAKKSFKKGRSL